MGNTTYELSGKLLGVGLATDLHERNCGIFRCRSGWIPGYGNSGDGDLPGLPRPIPSHSSSNPPEK